MWTAESWLSGAHSKEHREWGCDERRVAARVDVHPGPVLHHLLFVTHLVPMKDHTADFLLHRQVHVCFLFFFLNRNYSFFSAEV